MKKFLFLILILSFNVSAGEKTIAEWIQDKFDTNNLEVSNNCKSYDPACGLVALVKIQPQISKRSIKRWKDRFCYC